MRTIATDLLGATATVYGLVGAFSFLLQARHMTRCGRSQDVSLGFLATVTGGYLIWLLYGLITVSIPLIVVDAAGVVCGTITCSIVIRLRPRPKSPPPADLAFMPSIASTPERAEPASEIQPIPA